MSELISLQRLLLSILNKVAPIVVEQLQDVGEIALRPYTKNISGQIEIRVGKPIMLITITIVDCSIVIKAVGSDAVRLDLNDESSLSEDKLAITILGVVSRGLASKLATAELRSQITGNKANTILDDYFYFYDKDYIYTKYKTINESLNKPIYSSSKIISSYSKI